MGVAIVRVDEETVVYSNRALTHMLELFPEQRRGVDEFCVTKRNLESTKMRQWRQGEK